MIDRAELFRDRKFYILLGLLLLLVIVNLGQWGGTSPAAIRAKESRSVGQKSLSVDPVLMTQKLSDDKLEFEQEKRNIFAFFHSVPAESLQTEIEEAPPPAPPEPVCGNSICEEGEDLTNCEVDCQPTAPPSPVITLRYIGYLHEAEGSVAFLTDGKEVYMGRVNDVIANQYRVLKITEETVELGFLDNNQSSTIRFQGSQGG
jgi:hypothetical protein